MPAFDILGPDKFARGRVKYLDYLGDSLDTARIILPVTFGDRVRTFAIVDTGSPWCILNPQEAAILNIDYSKEGQKISRFVLLGWQGAGWLCEIPMILKAEIGQDIALEATVFIPQLHPNQRWMFPNFLGLSGFLNKIRFAVDPEHNHFYFGACRATSRT